MTRSSRRYGLNEVLPFLHAVRLARHAQDIGWSSVPDVATKMTNLRWLPRRVAPAAAGRAAERACSRLARWSSAIDTCLIRALVAGVLLSDQAEVYLHLAFGESEEPGPGVRGHAWVSVANEVLADGDWTEPPGAGLAQPVDLPLKRRETAPVPPPRHG